jgi:hypothetical protein
MKTRLKHLHKGRRGSVVIFVLALLFIMVIFVAANTVTVNWLRRQVNVVEQHQIQRLAPASTHPWRSAQAATNQPASK